MWTATWKSLLAHKLRLALTATAVVLGIAFVSGTLMLTDTLRSAFEEVFGEVITADVTVRGEAAFTDMRGSRQWVPPHVVDEVAGVDGVAVVEPVVMGYAQLINADGEPVGGQGPPTLGYNVVDTEALTPTDLRDGRYPTEAGEVAIDAFTADQHGFAVGDTVQVLTTGPVQEAEVVGIVGFGGLDNLAGATLTLFDHETAMGLYSPDGSYESIELLAASGVGQEELRDRVVAALGSGYEVLTREELAAESTNQLTEGLQVFTIALLVFAGVSLFVGAFIIFNTFSIIVAQRTRELALLRAVGAGRRQLLGSVLGEALAVGLAGSAIGLGAGVGLALGLQRLLAAFGLDLPTTTLQIQPRTIIAAFVLGAVVTTIASVVPSLRATRVPPVAALQEVAAPPVPRFGRARHVVGVVVVLLGVAALAQGMFAGGGLSVVGAGAALTLLGVALLSALVARPIVRVVGWPAARLFGIRGHLARENAMRNPRRTASTAAALMIGLGLVGFVTIFAASLKASVGATVDEVYLADFQVAPVDPTGMIGLSPETADAVAAVDEVALVSPQTFGQFRYNDKTLILVGVDPATVESMYAVDVLDGSMAGLPDNGLAASEKVADAEGWAVGDMVTVEFPATGEQDLHVAGIFDASALDVDFLIANQTMEEHFREPQVMAMMVRLHDGAVPEEVQPKVEAALAGFPTAQVLDRAGIKAQIEQQVNQLLGLVFALLFLSVVIALFGIVNTLALSVLERVRELGLLRAVGMTRRQVRAMVRWESVMIAVLGAGLGLAVGTFFGWITVTALADEGFTRFVVPGGQLAAAVVAAGVAGVLAAVLPARRAARVDVLRAVTVE